MLKDDIREDQNSVHQVDSHDDNVWFREQIIIFTKVSFTTLWEIYHDANMGTEMENAIALVHTNTNGAWDLLVPVEITKESSILESNS